MTTKHLGDVGTTKKINLSEVGTTKKINLSKGKGANNTSSKKGAITSYKQDKGKEDEDKKLFHYRLPEVLRIVEEYVEVPMEIIKEEKKHGHLQQEEVKSNQISTFTQINVTSSEPIKDEHTSVYNESDSDLKRKENEVRNKKREINEKELDANVFITFTETPTTFMFFTPSTKYFRDRNEIEAAEEKKKEEYFKLYKEKRKNEESFTKRGAQTINKFKRNQVVSTSSMRDQESQEPINEMISALNWNITDSISENKNKKDDESKNFQKILDRKIKNQLNDKIKSIDKMTNPDESYTIHKSQLSSENNINNTASIYETRQTQSLQTIQINSRPKPRYASVNEGHGQGQSSLNGSQIKINSGSNPNNNLNNNANQNAQIKKILNMELANSVINPLRYVERLLAQNQYHYRQTAYKNYPIIYDEVDEKRETKNSLLNFEYNKEVNEDPNTIKQKELLKKELELVTFEEKNSDPDLKFLFRFSGQKIIKESNSKYLVQCLDWNPYNQDLLAAGYGDPDIDSNKEGLLCFWTLKNPLHPERVIRTPRGITSCNFSSKNPFYLVASDYAGEIMIYDLRSNSNKPIADSTEDKDKHTDIVWEAKWIERPNDKNEVIVSISSDGKVKEWSLKKALEVTDLMHMKKSLSYPDKRWSPFAKLDRPKENSKESLVFRDANGLSFDFPKNDKTIYYISTEECTLHRCRISYKDQFTHTFYGHQGPAYKVRCNPFDPNFLLSCSYDWSVKIWSSKQSYPLITCHSPKLFHQINDIEWSPFTSTIFGCVADDGRIEIWDLSKGSVEATIKWLPSLSEDHKHKIGVPRKCIKFSQSSQVIATGDADFDIDIFRLYNLKHVEVSDEDQIRRLQTIISQNSEFGSKLN